MAEVFFSIGQISKAAFGRKPVIISGQQQDANISYAGLQVISQEQATQLSELGTPIICPVNIRAGSYNIVQKGQQVQKTYPAYSFPPATLISFDRAKIIVETQAQGRDFRVKELICMDDWNISIQGFITAGIHNNTYPAAEVEAMRAMFETPASLEVDCLLFNKLNISHMVCYSISFPRPEGLWNVQPFSLSCKADENILLTKKLTA